MKKLISLTLALMLVLSLATTAFAANETAHTITINNSAAGYEYAAYQIFKGDIVDGELTNIEWGGDITDGAALLTALKNNTAFAACETVVDVAAVLAANTDKDHDTTKAFADIVSGHLNTTPAGTSTGDGPYEISVTGDGYYLVKSTKVPAATDTAAAGSYTRYILKVAGDISVNHKGTVPTVTKTIGSDAKTGDYSIGDTVSYQLNGTLPSNYADYKAYYYQFTDTLSDGLTYNKDAKVYVVNGTTETEVTDSFTINHESNPFTVTCTDLKTLQDVTVDANSKIVVKYSCTLNSGAVVGGAGNSNQVVLTFSNDPNAVSNGTTGNTPVDKAVVFTFALNVTKVDGTDNTIKLEGANFKLQNTADNKWVTVADGKVTGWVDTQEGGSVLTSGSDGVFNVTGLADGTYNLVETAAPEGYNTLTDPVVITIASTYDVAGVKTLTIKVGKGNETNGTVDTGIVSTTVENNSGATLPETGGMGTVLFYVVGGFMMVAAVVLLVTKKRMAAE